MRVAIALCIAVSVGAYSPSSESQQNDWLLIPGVRAGPIAQGTSEELVVELFGSANVRREGINIGEGVEESGTVLFPNDPARRIEILWSDPETRRRPDTVRISGSESQWHLPHGIGLGTTLKELEALNKRPFEVAGWGWDYGGTISDWKGGALTSDLSVGEDVWIRLSVIDWQGSTQAEMLVLMGDGTFRSSLALVQKLNPIVQYAAITIHD